MFKTITKFRNKRKKKSKEPSDTNDNKELSKTDSDTSTNFLAPPPLPPLNSTDSDFRRNESENSILTIGDGNGSNISEYEDEVEEISRPEDIQASNLYDIYNKNHADEDRLFMAEFQLLKKLVSKQNPKCEHAKLSINSHKNRYKNIIACDNHRVKLSIINDDENSDYINASYIDGYSLPNKFIASQGPKESTLNDFWRMIWEQKCFVIVMITELRELGRQKCEQYWPDKEDGLMKFVDISVEFASIKSYGSFIKRELTLQFKNESRLISQFQYRAWPDHGVPKTTTALFRFREITLQAQPTDAGPVLVHCSAGVGRTGTYIALDVLLDQLKDTNKINVFELILEFRMRRAEMVQSLDQYSFIHKLVYEYYVLGNTDRDQDKFEHLYEILSNEIDDGVSGFDSSFKLLESSQIITFRFGSGALARNKDKNRDETIIPYEHSQIFIRMRPYEQLPVYINASPIQSYDINTNVIMAQAPMENTIEDFWRMVVDNNVICIAMLCQLKNEDKEDCAEYWPTTENSILDLGEIIVKNEGVTQLNDVVITTLTVEYCDREKILRTVTHLRHRTWVEENVLPSQGGATLIEMTKFVKQQLKCDTGGMKPRVVVHCSDGVGRSGVFCVVSNVVERLQNEGKIDILRTVKDLRDCRPCVVRTKEQYKMCYDIVNEYVQNIEKKQLEDLQDVGKHVSQIEEDDMTSVDLNDNDDIDVDETKTSENEINENKDKSDDDIIENKENVEQSENSDSEIENPIEDNTEIFIPIEKGVIISNEIDDTKPKENDTISNQAEDNIEHYIENEVDGDTKISPINENLSTQDNSNLKIEEVSCEANLNTDNIELSEDNIEKYIESDDITNNKPVDQSYHNDNQEILV